MTTTTEHIYHVEMALAGGIGGWQAVCRCGYRGPACTDRVDAASYGPEHCQLARKTVAR